MTKVAVIDFETTGLRSEDRAIEVALVFIEGTRIRDRYDSLMNPGRSIHWGARKVHGISDEMIQGKPSPPTVMRKVASLVGDIPLIAHNSSFDERFLDGEFRRIRKKRKNEFICTCSLARKLYPEAQDYTLETIVEHLDIQTGGTPHRAATDAMNAAKIWLAMMKKIRDDYRIRTVPPELVMELQKWEKTSWGNVIQNFRRN